MRKLLFVFSLLTLILILGSYFFIYPFFIKNVEEKDKAHIVFVPTDASFDDVLFLMDEGKVLKNLSTFKQVAKFMKYNKDKVPGGKYVLDSGMTNFQIIKKLRSGDQSPLNVTINNIRLLPDLAGKVAGYLEGDSMAFLNYFNDANVHKSMEFTQETFLSMFIPNTYEMFWTYTPEKFTDRMKKEYERFWTEERKQKLKKKNLTPTEAYIVASIVEKESNYDPERPRIAGVYLNRLREGIKLQADPTVVYATGDFSIKRVLFKHLELDSPYNTYRYSGLPPGPICMPSIQSLQAVIDAENHDYYFFCAKADNTGTHAFATTYSDHQKNAAAFSAWLNSRNIR